MIVFQKDGVNVERHSIAQTRSSSKDELFVTWNGYDFGVYQAHQITQAIDCAVNVANLPLEGRHSYRR